MRRAWKAILPSLKELRTTRFSIGSGFLKLLMSGTVMAWFAEEAKRVVVKVSYCNHERDKEMLN